MSDKELIKTYTLSNGKVFSEKMFNDLVIWKTFEEDYGIDKIGIKAFRKELYEHGIISIEEKNRLNINKNIDE